MTTKLKVIDGARSQFTQEEIEDLEGIIKDLQGRRNGHRNGYANPLYDELRQSIDERQGKAGSVIRVLQNAQNIIGYLPTPVIKVISQEMKVPLSEIYGIISFYHYFSLHPKGKYVIQVCMGTSCYVKGGQAILDALKKDMNLLPDEITSDGKFSLETVRCLGACGISPVISTGPDIHGRVKPSQIMAILDAYK